jgi:phosphopantetheine--protein transferase-like protein
MLPDSGFLKSALGEPLGLDLLFSAARAPARAPALSPTERVRFEALQNTARATSWLLGRAVLKNLHGEVDGCADIDELSFPNPRFSLSHSADVALAVAEPSGCLQGIGVDLEVDTRIQQAAGRFFLTEREIQWLESQTSERRPHHLLRLWCIKEAIFKANPDNAGKTLADHEIRDPGRAAGEARVRATGKSMEYASWCESRTCIALAVCR